MFAPPMPPKFSPTRLTTSEMIAPQAIQLFEHSLRTARWKWIVGRLHGRLRRLERLECVRAAVRLVGRHEVGLRAVPLEQIQGSVDGGANFDRDFYPVSARAERRWVRVATAILQGKSLPPVDLIALDDRYFVLDGHHRVSVARMLKQSHIDAVVTAWDVEQPPR